MNGPDPDRRLEELFALAVELAPAERDAFVARHCADDPVLGRELLALLAEDDEGTRDFLRSPVLSDEDTATHGAPLPRRIGRFRILDKIGEGGMGSIYLAEEEGPLARRFALKILKLGLNTRRVVARFEAERAAIERMDHPFIARVHDGGMTENGRPYFVMEYADGLPITEWCDREGLGVRERVALFADVCEAVQHAHQKGVIHRDLKPSNILVTDEGGRPVPKIIDFGIARAVDDDGTQGTTRHGEVVGSSNYMSPEQALGADDLDTRTDIYSLGVVLYELLAGVLPFDDLAGLPLADVQRHVVARVPVAPSVRVEQLGVVAATAAGRRGLTPLALSGKLRGDLDWIVLRAMETDRGQRYATSAAIGVDLRNHLQDIPVTVGPPSLSYRAQRFYRRNRTGVIFAGVAVVLLLFGVIGTTWGMLEASRQRDEATESARAADRARQKALAAEQEAQQLAERASAAEKLAENRSLEAEAKAAEAEEVTRFLVDIVSMANPEVTSLGDVDLTVRSLLERTGADVGAVFADSPQGELLVRRTMGRALHSLGAFDAADEHLRRALELLELHDEPPTEELFDTLWRLAEIESDLDGYESFALGYRAGLLGADAIAQTHPRLGGALRQLWESAYRGYPEEVRAQFEDTQRLAVDTLPAFHDHWLVVARIYAFLGDHLQRRHLGRHGNAIDAGEYAGRPLLEEAVRIGREVLPARHPDVARHLGLLVSMFAERGRFDLALRPAAEAVDIYRRALPDDHWLLARAEGMHAECLSGLGSPDATRLLVESHERIVASRGDSGRACIESAARLVRHFVRVDDAVAARTHRRELARALAASSHVPAPWDHKRLAFGERHAALVAAMDEFDALAAEDVLWHGLSRGQANRVRALAERILAERRALRDLDPLSVVVARQCVDWTRDLLAVDDDVVALFCADALDVLAPHRELLARDLAEASLRLGHVARRRRRFDEAERHFEHALADFRAAHGPRALDALECEVELGALRAWRHADADVEGGLVETWQRCVRSLGATHGLTRAALGNLVALHERRGDPRLAEPYVFVHLRTQGAGERVENMFATPAWFVVRADGFTRELYEMAVSSAHQHLADNPFAWSSQLVIGAGLYRLGRHDEALAQLEISEREHEGRAPLDALFLSLVSLARGDVDGAEAWRVAWEERAARAAQHERYAEQLAAAWDAWRADGGREPRAAPEPPASPEPIGDEPMALTEP